MSVLSIVRSTPQLPDDLDWKNPPVGWTFGSFAPDSDKTEAIELGTVPFESDDLAWGPPCFTPPDLIDNRYTIHERGMIRKAVNVKDVDGMKVCRRLTPAQLAEFLRERFAGGELTRL